MKNETDNKGNRKQVDENAIVHKRWQNEKNKARIDAEFSTLQKNCKVRLCTSDDVFDAVKAIMRKMNTSKKALEGCGFVVRPHAQKVPKAYKYHFEGTAFGIQVKNGNFQLMTVFRDDCGNRKAFQARLTDTAKEAILHDYIYF